MAYAQVPAGRAYSLGPLKYQVVNYTTATSDTSASVVATSIANVSFIVDGGGLLFTAAPTYSGNTVTLAFTVPTGGVSGALMVFGT